MKHLSAIAALVALLLAASACYADPSDVKVQPAGLGGCAILPADSIWNAPVDTLPVAHNSAAYIANISATESTLHPDWSSIAGGNYGIPFNIVPADQPKQAVTFEYADESDAGPYPIPANPKIENGGDRHILMLQKGSCKLYELYATEQDNGRWQAGSGAIFDMRSNALRADTWTSADAAGLPILPGLVRYDEVAAGAINHALRFTTACTADAYVWPARHKAVPNDCPAQYPAGQLPPPMGQRFRLKASVDISHFGPQTQVILTSLKKYGMMVADNGTSWYVSGAPDPGWDDDQLVGDLRQIRGSDFEAVDVSALMLSPNSGQVRSSATRPGPPRAFLPFAARMKGQDDKMAR